MENKNNQCTENNPVSEKKVKNISGRKWLITINNPEQHSFSRDIVIQKCLSLKNIDYIAFSEELAPTTQTPHYHIFLYRHTGISIQTLRNLFPKCRYDRANGLSEDCRNYVFKEGKWASSQKQEGNIKDSHYEYGELPREAQGNRTDLSFMYDLVKEGYTDTEILELCQDTAIKYLDKIARLRNTYLKDKFKNTRRLDIKVHYVTGKTGRGKSRDILDEYGDENVYRVTDYKNPFDSYQCEPVLVLEEFRSSLRLQDMLNYLDIYPVTLPARYSPKQCCYTTVIIVSNWEFEQQYAEVQKDREQKSTYDAWVRRFNGYVKVYTDTDIITYPTMQEYLNRNSDFHPHLGNSPFDAPTSPKQSLNVDETPMPFD